MANESKDMTFDNNTVNPEALLQRVAMFLEDGEWKRATEYCERVLDAEPENALAYLGLLMAQLKICKREQLTGCGNYTDNKNYVRVLQFGDEKLKAEILSYSDDVHENINAGDEFFLGHFEGEPIKWIVLTKENGEAMLLSKYALCKKKFNSDDLDAIWETSSIRSWLNNEFCKAAFNDNERTLLIAKSISNIGNPEIGVPAKYSTTDKVYLLSLADQAFYTQYSKCMYTRGGGDAIWWLRTPAGITNYAACVDDDGDVIPDGKNVDSEFGVRPVVWYKL